MIGQEKTQTYFSSDIDSGIKAIAEKVISEQRITEKEGIYLFEKGELGFLGVDVLQPFALALFIGVLIGTYSSIFIASPVMLFLETKYPIPELTDLED